MKIQLQTGGYDPWGFRFLFRRGKHIFHLVETAAAVDESGGFQSAFGVYFLGVGTVGDLNFVGITGEKYLVDPGDTTGPDGMNANLLYITIVRLTF